MQKVVRILPLKRSFLYEMPERQKNAFCGRLKMQVERPNAEGNRYALPSLFCQQLDMQMTVSHKQEFPVAFCDGSKMQIGHDRSLVKEK